MKLLQVVLKDRITAIGTSSFNAPLYDISYEAGMVTICRGDHPDEPPWMVPASNVVHMRPELKAKK
jgi:hypothetical protein